MAVVNTKATQVTEESAFSPWRYAGGGKANVLFAKSGLCAVASGDDDTSTYRLMRLPGRAVVKSIRLFNAAITAGTDYDFGLYAVGASDNGAVADADCYASNVDLSAAHVGTEIGFEARALTAHRQKVWEDAGAGSDPGEGTYYDLVATANTVGSANGSILVLVEYTLE